MVGRLSQYQEIIYIYIHTCVYFNGFVFVAPNILASGCNYCHCGKGCVCFSCNVG